MKLIKKIIFCILLSVLAFLTFNMNASAKSVNVYMFYGKTCPHCKEAFKYLNNIKDKYDLKIYKYEVWENEENKALMKEVATLLDINVRGVPFVVIDNTAIFGYASSVTDETYRYHIKMASKEDFLDKVGIKIGVVKETENSIQKEDRLLQKGSYKIKLPIVGMLDLKRFSLPSISVLLGVIDGFNPCAMWILLFFISTLIGVKDKKRLWTLGLIFLVTSSFIYMAFMVSWLSFDKMISWVAIVRIIIAVAAIIGGAINLNSFANSLNKEELYNVEHTKKENKYFLKVKNLLKKRTLIIAIIGILLLAISANLIELACSADFPVIFAKLLKMNNLSLFEYWFYIITYIFFFMLDDLIIFTIVFKTMQLTGISTKYAKYSHLASGIIMFIIGILLIVKPEWLMFNF